MTASVTIRVRKIDHYVLDMRTRMPFRYGIASMTALPHLFVRLEAVVDGHDVVGIASEGLAPKWFTKDPTTTFRDDLADMFRVIDHACETAVHVGEMPSVFTLWSAINQEQQRWAAAYGYPPLLAGLGASLVERAAIDAFCRATDQPFARAIRNGTLGLQLGAIHKRLTGHTPDGLLPEVPLRSVIARHTVGLADPLTDGEIPPDERLSDGLPQSLAACVHAYGLTHFKVKLFGSLEKDVDRLSRIARVISGPRAGVTGSGNGTYAFTLDGNEQFHDVAAFQRYWTALMAERDLAAFLRHLLFVEQPLHRDVALSSDAAALQAWAERPSMIIDESDGEAGSLPRALAIGYAGTSHKNCKGVFRGIANACLIAQFNREAGRRYILSGEDLANVGPVALLQDLAAMATLGVEHVERNGHHYFAGLSMLPDDVQAAVLADHGDLYRRHPAGFPTLDVRQGRLVVGSVVDAPFGTDFLLDPTRFTPRAAWRFDSLGVVE